jgi:hypothetical protein
LILVSSGLSLAAMKLYKSAEYPGQWIGTDAEGALVRWPAERGGWQRRTPYTGGKRQLEEVSSVLARGSGWPGGGTGRPPRQGASTRMFGIRATDDEIATWTQRADEEHKRPTVWARDTLNTEAGRPRGKAKP